MLKLTKIRKSFNGKDVLNNIDLNIETGEVYGLVGANGAGKTTLLNIIANVLTPDKGKIEIDGKKVESQNDIAYKIGYVLDIPAMFEYLSAHEYLNFLMCALKKDKEEKQKIIADILKTVGLDDVKGIKIKAFSRGMKQRMGIAAGLVCNPEIILLDEPSSALDPEGRAEVIGIIQKLKKQGKTVVFSTHILSDVERVCDRVGLLIDGKIKVEGSLQQILKEHTKPALVVESVSNQKIAKKLEKNEGVLGIEENNGILEISIDINFKEKIFKEILKTNVEINSIALKKVSLEEIFIKTKKGGAKWHNLVLVLKRIC